MKKHILAGTTARSENVFVTIEYDGKRLSLTGVVGPYSSGNASGGCGQIDLAKEVVNPADGIDIAKLDSIWRRWHLNDMRAGCEHQRATWNLDEEIELVTYRLTTEAMQEQGTIKHEAIEELKAGKTVKLTAKKRNLLCLPWETTNVESDDLPFYKEEKRETKRVNWVRPEEHPKGILCKPCEVCGYKYGSAWLIEEVPQEVIAFLESLPETDALPSVWR